MAKKNKADRKQLLTRIMCLVLAGIMIISSLMAAILSQVF